MRLHATLADLAGHLTPDPVPASGARLLARASRRVDTALLCAVYDVDQGGLPTDTTVAEALRDATLEQISWHLANGDSEGLGVVYTNVKIGSVALQRGGAGTDQGAAGELCPAAWDVLAAAGLTGQGPRAC